MNIKKTAILQKGRGKIRKQAKLVYMYEKESRYLAQVAESIKDIAAQELESLGAYELKPVFRGIWFKADQRDFYKIVYCSRLVSRILAPLASFECKDKNDLYRAARKIRWEELLGLSTRFSITANVSDSGITHSNFAGLKVKDAIADYFRDRTGRRPSVNADQPDIIINIHIHRDIATLSVDASAGPMHRRGYREESVSAPMQETVAASIIALSQWDGTKPLYDPMCGSGTLLCEALMKYCRIPAMIFREKFGFERLPDFNARVWDKVKKQLLDEIKEPEKGLVSGSDISEDSVNAAKTNIMGLHFGDRVLIEQKDFRDIDSLEDHVIVANPPYGIRMGKDENLNLFYRDLGLFLKDRCHRSQAFIYFGEPRYIKKLPLAPSWKRPLKIGGLNGKLVKYEVY